MRAHRAIDMAQILKDHLASLDAGLIDTTGEEVETGFVVLTGPTAQLHPDRILSEATDFINKNPANMQQGYSIGWTDPEPGAQIQRVELRATWSEIERITEPGDTIWDLSEPRVFNRS